MDDDEILAVAQAHAENLEQACQALVDRANAKGGDDNVTVVLVQVETGNEVESGHRGRRSRHRRKARRVLMGEARAEGLHGVRAGERRIVSGRPAHGPDDWSSGDEVCRGAGIGGGGRPVVVPKSLGRKGGQSTTAIRLEVTDTPLRRLSHRYEVRDSRTRFASRRLENGRVDHRVWADEFGFPVARRHNAESQVPSDGNTPECQAVPLG